MSADHGFAVIPEAEKARDPSFSGGRLVNTERAMPTVYERLNRYLTGELCLPPGSRPVFGGEGWNVAYNRPAFPMRTVEGPCGPAERPVTLADLDAAFPKAVAALFTEEIETVLLVSGRDRWPADHPATEFARNDFDAERSGDAFLVPRPGVLMHWDPGRGSHHGSHHAYDTHVPLVFWGTPFPAGRRDRETTPYDLAPTLAELLGVDAPRRDRAEPSRPLTAGLLDRLAGGAQRVDQPAAAGGRVLRWRGLRTRGVELPAKALLREAEAHVQAVDPLTQLEPDDVLPLGLLALFGDQGGLPEDLHGHGAPRDLPR